MKVSRNERRQTTARGLPHGSPSVDCGQFDVLVVSLNET
jgi:hypothetical protein